VAFGDVEAASLDYAFVVDGRVFPLLPNACVGGPGGGLDESSAVHCNLGFEGAPAQSQNGRLEVRLGEAGTAALSVDIAFHAFNYCGDGMAQIVVSAGDAGLPTATAVTYVDACSL